MKYWFPDVPAIVWSALFLLVLFGLNYLSTRSFGESEYVFSSIKGYYRIRIPVLWLYAYLWHWRQHLQDLRTGQ